MDNLKSQLNALKSIQPDADWKSTQKEMLIKQISGSISPEVKVNYFTLYIKEAFAYDLSFLTQPVVSLAIIFMLIVSGAFFSMTAASEATPGSFLYTLKIVGEKTQFALTTKPEEKVKLGVSFVEHRVDEITTVASNNDNEVLAKLTENLASGIIGVQNDLAQIENDDPDSALRLAKDIDQKTSQLREKLVSTKNMLAKTNEQAVKQINDAIEGVDAAGLKALNTIVKTSTISKESNTDNDVNDRMAVKIENTKDKINALQENLNAVFSAGLGRSEQGVQIYDINEQKKQADAKAVEAGKVIAEAEKLLEDNNYSEALAKISESENLIKEASNVAETESANNENEAEEEQSSSTPEVKGVMEIAPTDDADENTTTTTTSEVVL